MSEVTVKSVRKVVVLGWDTSVVKGTHVSISAKGHDGVERELRNTENDGAANIYFPSDYSGSVDVVLRGSKGGVAESTVSVD